MKKIIKRRYFDTNSIFKKSKIGYFINTGVWADGHLAYSRCTEDGEILEEGEYYQLKGKLINLDTHQCYKCLYMQHV